MIASSDVCSLSAMSVSRRYDPTFRLSMKRTLVSLIPCSRSSSSLDSVSSSLHCRTTSPVASSMTSLAATLPTRSVTSTASRSTFESFSFLIASLVNLRFFLTRISRVSGWRMSRLARWPGSRSYSTDFAYFLFGSR